MLYPHRRMAADLAATRTELHGDVAEVRRDLHALAERVARVEGAMTALAPAREWNARPGDQIAPRRGRVSGAAGTGTRLRIQFEPFLPAPNRLPDWLVQAS